MKRPLIFNIFAFIFILNFIKGSDPLSRRVRNSIINRSRQKQTIVSSRSTRKTFIDKVPVYVPYEIWSFLDIKSLLKLKNTCKDIEKEVNEYFKQTINQICPNCVLQDTLVNGFLHFILKENYPKPTKDIDINIQDHLALIIIKFISYDHVPKEIPRLVYHHILQFLFEIIFESDESIPVYEESWRNWLVFKLQRHSLPRTLEYFINIRKERYDMRQNWDLEQWKCLLEFVATNPHPSTQSRFLKENYLYSHVNVVSMPHEFTCFFFDSLHHELVSKENLPLVFLKLLNYNHLSRSMMTRLTVDDYNYLSQKIEIYEYKRDLNYKRFILENFDQRYGQVWNYIWSRDDNENPFNPTELNHMKFNTLNIIYDIINTPSPKLVHIEIFSFLIRKMMLQEIQPYENNLVQILSTHSNNLYWDILLNESETPVNLFYSAVNGKKFHVYENEFRPPYSQHEQNIKSFVESLSKEHPLPLLFVHVTALEIAKDLITNKFNLNQRYIFDGSFDDFVFINFDDEIEARIQGQGQVMRFIDILRLKNNERLNEIFGLSFFNEEIIKDSSIYSVSKFLNFAIFEEI